MKYTQVELNSSKVIWLPTPIDDFQYSVGEEVTIFEEKHHITQVCTTLDENAIPLRGVIIYDFVRGTPETMNIRDVHNNIYTLRVKSKSQS